MIFKEKIFKIPTECIYKEQMNGLGDKTLPDFEPISFSCAIKSEHRRKWAEEEIIQSYLMSAKLLANNIRQQNQIIGIKIFNKESLAIPTIYLCRHSIELSLKNTISKISGHDETGHDLVKLWNKFNKNISPYISLNNDKCLLDTIEEFIFQISNLDDNGNKLRYVEQIKGGYSQEKFLWVNVIAIVEQTESLINQLKLINEECISQ
jgi:hypothetical protein